MGSLVQLRPPASDATSPGASTPTDGGSQTPEATLVERARGGDVDAWSRLYQDNFDPLYRHVAYLVGEAHATEDLVQETFAHAVVGLRQFTGRSSLQSWLRGIALNLVRRHWRSRTRGTRAMDRLGHAHHTTPQDSPLEGAYLRQRHAEVLLAVLDTLPPALREAFVMCDLREVPLPEAAADLGISLNNLRVRATRARARIRDELTRLGWVSAAPDEGAGP